MSDEKKESAELELYAESWSSEDQTQDVGAGDGQTPGDTGSRIGRRPHGSRLRRCLIIGCRATFTGSSPMARHVLDNHCPPGICDPVKMVKYLREMAGILGVQSNPGDTDERVLDRLRGVVQRGFVPVKYEFGVKTQVMAGDLARYLGLAPITEEDLVRFGRGLIVHTGMLAHPRVMASLLNQMSPNHREQLRTLWGENRRGVVRVPSPVGFVAPEDWDSVCADVGERQALGAQSSPRTTNPHSYLRVVDAHWHPTRMAKPFDLQEALTDYVDRLPGDSNIPVKVVVGCAVYIDGVGPPMGAAGDGWVSAVGIHPTQVTNTGVETIQRIVDDCLEHGWALGEVGLDYYKGQGWGKQRWVLGQFCKRVTAATPMVLHLRGCPCDVLGREPMWDVLQLLHEAGTPLWAPIYLHSLSGGPKEVEEWLFTGRVVFFGVSGLVFRASPEQLAGVRRIPQDRLLVETDSPYLRVGPGEMTPGQISTTYVRVARERGEGLVELVAAVNHNFKLLYSHQLRVRHC